MEKCLVFINGLHLPYQVLDASIAWAKAHDASLFVLFMTATTEESDGYIFPSDINAAEALTDEDDALRADRNLLKSQLQIVLDMASGEGVICEAISRAEPSIKDIVELTRDAVMLFMETPDTESFPLMGVTDFTMSELSVQAECPVLIIDK